jgi:hypothetical protein
MPSAVSDHGPSVFLSAQSGFSESRISLSMDLRATSWLGSAVLLVRSNSGCGQVFGLDCRGRPAFDQECLRRSVQGKDSPAESFSACFELELRGVGDAEGNERRKTEGPGPAAMRKPFRSPIVNQNV